LLQQQEQRDVNGRCSKYVAMERDLEPGARFCGARAPRLNPCWKEEGQTFCLPLFFVLGEMKCGTTTLYQLLLKHPQMRAPRAKEPRFLQQGRFQQTSLSRYVVNFDTTSLSPDAVTFDASPVYLRSPPARMWISRWLPKAKLIVLVRDPAQRAYSHWNMGYEWLQSKCDTSSQKRKFERIAPMITFRGIAERSIMMMNINKCKQMHKSNGTRGYKNSGLGSGFQLLGNKVFTANPGSTTEEQLIRRNPVLQCLFDADEGLTRDFMPELRGTWPDQQFVDDFERAKRDVGQCSEMMMVPPSCIMKSASYAVELERWAQIFPPSQLKVIATDDFAASAQRTMNETFAFLGLPAVNVGGQSRFCVRGKAGVMDVLKAADLNIAIGSNQTSRGENEKIKVGDCEGDSQKEKKHVFEPELDARLRRFFAPYNRRLYRFLGRDLGW